MGRGPRSTNAINSAYDLLFGPRKIHHNVPKRDLAIEALLVKFEKAHPCENEDSLNDFVKLIEQTSWDQKMVVLPLLTKEAGVEMLRCHWRQWALPADVYTIDEGKSPSDHFILLDHMAEIDYWVDHAKDNLSRKGLRSDPWKSLSVADHHYINLKVENEAQTFQKLFASGAVINEQEFQRIFQKDIRQVVGPVLEHAVAKTVCFYNTSSLKALVRIEKICSSNKRGDPNQVMMAAEQAAVIFATERECAHLDTFGGEPISNFLILALGANGPRRNLTAAGAGQLAAIKIRMTWRGSAKHDGETPFSVSTIPGSPLATGHQFCDVATDAYARALGISPDQSREYLKRLGEEVEQVYKRKDFPVSDYIYANPDPEVVHGKLATIRSSYRSNP